MAERRTRGRRLRPGGGGGVHPRGFISARSGGPRQPVPSLSCWHPWSRRRWVRDAGSPWTPLDAGALIGQLWGTTQIPRSDQLATKTYGFLRRGDRAMQPRWQRPRPRAVGTGAGRGRADGALSQLSRHLRRFFRCFSAAESDIGLAARTADRAVLVELRRFLAVIQAFGALPFCQVTPRGPSAGRQRSPP